MTITLVKGSGASAVTTTLCHGQTRNSAGNPVGPANLRMSLAPGVAVREYVGADRVAGEHVRCDKGTLTFDVERVFGSVADALAYVRGAFLSENSEGTLKFDSSTVFSNAAVTSRSVAVVGCAVAVSYTIEG